ncbi:MAG: hypothetical protein U1G08_06840 [Verrucomicrobiota bacterium]
MAITVMPFTTPAFGGPLDLPILGSAIVFSLDVNSDGINEFEYGYGAASMEATPPAEYYRVSIGLKSFGAGRYVVSRSGEIPFSEGEEISISNGENLTQTGSNWIGLLGYDESREIPGAVWNFFDVFKKQPGQFWRTKTDFLIGIRFNLEDGPHHGWIRFHRKDLLFTTAFEVASYDWNPEPRQSIRAGFPPEIQISSARTSDGLHLSWPTSVLNWVLEYSASLGTNAVWIPVGNVNGNDAVLPLTEDHQFYRLRRP